MVIVTIKPENNWLDGISFSCHAFDLPFFLLCTLPLFTRTLQVLIFSPSPYYEALIPLVRAIKL
jgi:hypothetical protein